MKDKKKILTRVGLAATAIATVVVVGVVCYFVGKDSVDTSEAFEEGVAWTAEWLSGQVEPIQ